MKDNLKLDMLDRRTLWRTLIMFALPIIGSGVVQQSFNSVDLAVVGHFIGSNALAAVGANGAVISLIITMFMGIALGANVVIARALGARQSGGGATFREYPGIVLHSGRRRSCGSGLAHSRSHIDDARHA